jgi:hypothetical protein
MSKLPSSPEIAGLFALATPFDAANCDWPRWSMPKLNGVRAMWVPGVGMFSRDGIPYETGVLPHIEAACAAAGQWLDGELYIHGAPLQDINSRASIMRRVPHPDVGALRFHVFDMPQIAKGAEDRYNMLCTLKLQGRLDPGAIEVVEHRDGSCWDKARTAFTSFVAAGYEGAVYKHHGGYVPGRGKMLLKYKAWSDEDYDVVDLVQGQDGKFDHSLGAVICRDASGVTFTVGSFAFDDDTRLKIWVDYKNGLKPARVKVKFLGLTRDKKPYNTQVLAFL